MWRSILKTTEGWRRSKYWIPQCTFSLDRNTLKHIINPQMTCHSLSIHFLKVNTNDVLFLGFSIIAAFTIQPHISFLTSPMWPKIWLGWHHSWPLIHVHVVPFSCSTTLGCYPPLLLPAFSNPNLKKLLRIVFGVSGDCFGHTHPFIP